MGKIFVERILASGTVVKKKYAVVDGHVIIKTGGLGRGNITMEPEIKPEYIVEEPVFFGLLGVRRKVYYMDGAKTLSPILPKGDIPRYTVDHYVKSAEATLLEKQAKTTTQTTSIALITLIGMVLQIFMIWVIWTKLGIVNV